MTWRRILWWVSCAALPALAGCAPAGPGDGAAARVNGVPILHEEVDIVRRHKGVAEHGAPAQELLSELVVKELFAQQFMRTVRGSARHAESALSVARRELLAQRYVSTVAAAVAPPDAEQVRAFYRAHPPLFAERRAFVLRALDIAAPPGREAELQARIGAAGSFDQLVHWLREAGLRFAWSETEHTSDELAPESLAHLAAMRAHDVTVLSTPRGLRVIELLHARPAALDERAARPLIEKRLWAQMRAEAVDAEVRRLTRLAAISIPDGAMAPGNGALTAIPAERPAVLSWPAPTGRVTGGAPEGGDAP